MLKGQLRPSFLGGKGRSTELISQLICRSCSSGEKPRSQFDIFDRKMKLKRREYPLKLPDHNVFDYLKKEFGFRLFDSLLDIKR